MQLSPHIVLITGGGSGIGRALAERFLQAGSEVIICGRREDVLRSAQQRHPEIHVKTCDIEDEAQRNELAEWAIRTYPKLDVLVNNAGIQRRVRLAKGADWRDVRQEIAIDLDAQIHLSLLFIPHLLEQAHPAIINVTSGLAFVPLASAPIYCATKAALHSFTLSLRHQLASTPIEVIELIPPAVNTDLGGAGVHAFATPLDEFVDAAMTQLAAGAQEITYGFSAQSSRASRDELRAIFARMNGAES